MLLQSKCGILISTRYEHSSTRVLRKNENILLSSLFLGGKIASKTAIPHARLVARLSRRGQAGSMSTISDYTLEANSIDLWWYFSKCFCTYRHPHPLEQTAHSLLWSTILLHRLFLSPIEFSLRKAMPPFPLSDKEHERLLDGRSNGGGSIQCNDDRWVSRSEASVRISRCRCRDVFVSMIEHYWSSRKTRFCFFSFLLRVAEKLLSMVCLSDWVSNCTRSIDTNSSRSRKKTLSFRQIVVERRRRRKRPKLKGFVFVLVFYFCPCFRWSALFYLLLKKKKKQKSLFHFCHFLFALFLSIPVSAPICKYPVLMLDHRSLFSSRFETESIGFCDFSRQWSISS